MTLTSPLVLAIFVDRQLSLYETFPDDGEFNAFVKGYEAACMKNGIHNYAFYQVDEGELYTLLGEYVKDRSLQNQVDSKLKDRRVPKKVPQLTLIQGGLE